MVEIKILGMKELDDMLKKLPEDFQIKAGWKSVIEAAKIVRDKAAATVPVAAEPHYQYRYRRTGRAGRMKTRGMISSDPVVKVLVQPGTVRRAIQARRMKQTNRAIMQYMVGPFKSRSLPGAMNDPFYWKWLEYGKKGYAPKRFLRNAFDSSTLQCIETMRAALATYIDRANKRLTKYRLPT